MLLPEFNTELCCVETISLWTSQANMIMTERLTFLQHDCTFHIIRYKEKKAELLCNLLATAPICTVQNTTRTNMHFAQMSAGFI